MKFLVTGHKGFIGSHFVKRLDSYDGYDLVNGRDLKTIKFFPDCDVVVHLAATNGTDLFYYILNVSLIIRFLPLI